MSQFTELRRLYRLWRYVLLGACLIAAIPVREVAASVVLGGTRVIYDADEREVTLKVTNVGSTPALIQAWIDTGDINAPPDQANIPFTLTPPLFRLDQAKGQTLRIIYTQNPLPSDRESLFWLNVLEIPPAPPKATAPANSLQFAVRSRIKLLFRPKDLASSSGAAEAFHWVAARETSGHGISLRADNPTPYYVTFSRIAATIAGKSFQNTTGGMVGPHGSLMFRLENAGSTTRAADSIEYAVINDYGAAVTGSSRLATPR